MKKIYLDGKQCPSGWSLKTYVNPNIIQDMNGFVVSVVPGEVDVCIETFRATTSVKQIYHGWNSIHFITKEE